MMYSIFDYFSRFLRAAKRAGWSQARIDAVLDDARSHDYVHAMSVLLEAYDNALTEIEPKEKVFHF